MRDKVFLGDIYRDLDARLEGRTFKVVNILEDEAEIEILTDPIRARKRPTVGFRRHLKLDRLREPWSFERIGNDLRGIGRRCDECGKLLRKAVDEDDIFLHKLSGRCRARVSPAADRIKSEGGLSERGLDNFTGVWSL